MVGGAMGGGGGGGAARTPVVAPDSVRSRAIIEIVEAWGWGEIAGFPEGADPLEHVYLDGTPVKSNGVLNFQGVTFDYRLGTQDQTYIPGIVDDTVGSSEAVGVQVTHAMPITRTITDPSTDAVRVIITFAGLMVQDTNNGDRLAATVNLQIDVRAAGGAWTAIDLQGRGTIRDKTESPYQRAYHINLRAVAASAASYDIRVTRLSADPAKNERSAFSWDSLVRLTYAKLRRPNVPHCRITFDAQYFSSIPTRSYDLLGLTIQVPTADVYDATARTYTGADWSGTLIKRWSRNPAWFLYHLLTTAGSGLGDEINPAYQDKWAIYSIAKRCDELVPDGYGGMEPRYSIDAQFMAQTGAHEMIQALAGIFDAQALWDGKSVYLTQDAPKPVTALYLPANVVGGRFVYAGSARQVRYTAAFIQYNDPTDQYKLVPEYVEDFDGIQRYGYRPKTETAIGCTSRGEAHRRGKRLLVTGREEIDSVTFSTGLSGVASRPGDIIRIADPLRSGGQRLGGRISTGSTSSVIKLDNPVTLASGTSYRLAVIGNDGAVWDAAITNAAGSASAITVSPAYAQAPAQELEWIIYDPLAVGQLFRILGISENDDKSNGFYTVSATQYAPGKFAEIDDTADLQAIPANPYIVGGVIPPSGVQATDGTYTGLEGLRRYIDISWTASNDPLLRGYLLSYKLNGTLIIDREINGQSYRIDNPLTGNYEITLAAINLGGKQSNSITITHVLGELYAITAVHVTNLALPGGTGNFTGRDAYFSWSTDADTVLGSAYATGQGGQSPWFRDFEIRVFNGPTLLRTEYITESHYSYTFEKNTDDGGPRRSFTVKVRARDFYGRYSQEAALTATNPAPTNFGAVTLTPGIRQIFLTYVQPSDPDYLYTRIFASQVQGFTPSNATLVGETTDRVTAFPTATVGVWYVRLQGVDEFGVSGAVYSTEISTTVYVADIAAAVDAILADPGKTGDTVVEATRFLVVQPGQATPKTAVFGVGMVGGVSKVGIRGDLLVDGTVFGRAIGANEITADKMSVATLSAINANLGMVTAGTFKTSPLTTGWRVEMSDSGVYPIWYGTGAKTAVNARFYLDTGGNAFFGGSINVNSRFTVGSDGTVIIKDAVGATVFASGTGINWGFVAGRPTSLATLNAVDGGKLTGIQDGATKNVIYRQGGTVPVGQGGDVWYVTTATSGYVTGATYLYAAGWQKMADITATQLAGSGVNVLNARYTTFEEPVLPPLLIGAGAVALDGSVGYFGTKSLKFSATSSADTYCFLGASGADYNFSIQPGRKWIASVYVRCSAANKALRLGLRGNSTIPAHGYKNYVASQCLDAA
jgi:predicted phage tail protein